MFRRIRLPSPALTVATIALLVALTGSAAAITVAAVPLAKRALLADNASKLQGKTAVALLRTANQAANQAATQAAQKVAELPGPASSAAGLVTVKTQSAGQMAPKTYQVMVISCDGGAKIMSAGFSSDGPVFNFSAYPTSDTTWSFGLENPDEAAHNVSLYATCIK